VPSRADRPGFCPGKSREHEVPLEGRVVCLGIAKENPVRIGAITCVAAPSVLHGPYFKGVLPPSLWPRNFLAVRSAMVRGERKPILTGTTID
jgi:hypothetical protein